MINFFCEFKGFDKLDKKDSLLAIGGNLDKDGYIVSIFPFVMYYDKNEESWALMVDNKPSCIMAVAPIPSPQKIQELFENNNFKAGILNKEADYKY